MNLVDKNKSVKYISILGNLIILLCLGITKSYAEDNVLVIHSYHADHAIVDSVNSIAQMMQMKTIAEFVENEQILAILAEIGVDYAQGYGIGKPVDIMPSPSMII